MDKTNAAWAKNVPCRNVIIYGYCKKIQEGCPFKHDSDESNKVATATPVASSIAAPSNVVSSANVNAPVPLSAGMSNSAGSNITQSSSITSSTAHAIPKFNAKASASFTPMSANSKNIGSDEDTNNNNTTTSTTTSTSNNQIFQGNANPAIAHFTPTYDAFHSESFTPASSVGNMMGIRPPSSDIAQVSLDNISNINTNVNPIPTPNIPININRPGTATSFIAQTPPVDSFKYNMKFPNLFPPPHSLLQYHLYAPDPPPHLQLSLKPNESTPETLFIPNNIREQLLKKNIATLQVFPPGGVLPNIINEYFGLVPLDFHKNDGEKNRYSDHKNSLYKVFSNNDGNVYILRRVHDILNDNIDPNIIRSVFKSWNDIKNNSNIVNLKDLFITTQFGDCSLCAIYDYYPQSISVYEKHFVNYPYASLTQELIWSYMIQMINAINEIHRKGLFIGQDFDWNKILVTGDPGRVKVTINHAHFVLNNINLTNSDNIKMEQQNDFINLGKICLELAKKVQASPMSNNSGTSHSNVQSPLLVHTPLSTPIINKGSMDFNTLTSPSKNQSNSSVSNNAIMNSSKSAILNGLDQNEQETLNEADKLLDESINKLNNIDNQFKEALRYLLLHQDKKNKSLIEFIPLIYDKLLSQINSSQTFTEYVEGILSKELENARLFRLMCKLNCIFGRLESRVDINWSESGEKFPIILFYDYVFHQINEKGKSVMDLTHVLRCLNKLDCGVKEKIMLVTPDEMNCIIISYKELKALVDSTFRSMVL